jgi:hypothetical protein
VWRQGAPVIFLFYFISFFIFLLGKQKKVKPAQCKLFLDGETGKRANGHRRTLADGFICLRVDTVCLCVWGVSQSLGKS